MPLPQPPRFLVMAMMKVVLEVGLAWVVTQPGTSTMACCPLLEDLQHKGKRHGMNCDAVVISVAMIALATGLL